MSRSTFGVSVIPFIRFVFSCFISIRSGLGTEISFGGKATITIPGVFGSFCFIWDFLVSLFQFFSLSFFFVVFFLAKQNANHGWMVVVVVVGG